MPLREIAKELNIEPIGDINQKIKEYALKRVETVIIEFNVKNIDQLQKACCDSLKLEFEEFSNQDELDLIIKKYIALGDFVIASCKDCFNDDTFARMFKLKDQFLAVVDSTGEKKYRRNFTRWHEIAHLLTTNPSKYNVIMRQNRQRDPVEALMDEIASEIAFHDNFFNPVFEEYCGDSVITFDKIRMLINQGFQDASFISTVYACIRKFKKPVLFLECALNYKKSEEKDLYNGFLFPEYKPIPKLRALNVFSNNLAKKRKFYIPKNMRVPEKSIIYDYYFKDLNTTSQRIENLDYWSSSDGKRLHSQEIFVDVCKYMDKIITLIIPTD